MSRSITSNPLNGLRWLPWAMLAGLPLLFLPDAVDPYGTIRWLALAVMAVLALGLNFRHWGQMVADVNRWVLVAMLVFCLAGIASLAVALHPLEGLMDVSRWLMVLGLMVALSWAMRRDPLVLRDLWRAGATAGWLVGGIRWLQLAGVVGGIPEGGDPTAATLGNPNFFAGAMVLLTACGIGAALLEKGLWRWIGIGSAAFCEGMSFIGQTTGATLALVAMGIVLAEGWLTGRWPESLYAKKPLFRIGIYSLGILGAGLAFGWVMLDKPMDITPGTDSTLERVLLWKKSAQMIQEAPVLGVGAGHWHYHILRLGAVSNYQGFATRYYMEAHNDYLQMAAERGILGGLGFLGMLGLAWANGWRRVREGKAAHAQLAAWAGLTAWMVFAFTNLPGEQSYLIVFWIVFGAVLIPGKMKATGGTSQATPAWLPKMGAGIAAMLMAGSVFSLVIHAHWAGAERGNLKLLDAKGRQDWPRTLKLAAEASQWHQRHDRVSATPFAWYEGISLLSMGDAKAAIPRLEAAKIQHPWHPQIGSNLGAAYFMAGNREKAAEELTALLERFPQFDEARMNLTEVLLTL
ncbi:MAG TPA: O-antigen ligase family protein, partial [Bacteroidia bacterium]|nr:O-antigen ligase family protein [Bacteroidia bacterium]